ncbi:MAG: hypothetical protein ACK44E_05050 [Anaerolineales bacterium]
MTNLNLSEKEASDRLRWVDWIFIIFLLTFSALFTLERIQWDYPHVFLGGDASNIVSFALAKNHPDWYPKDFLLRERQNFDIYLQFHVLYTQWAEKLFGDAILGFLSLLPITILLYLGGLYFLGRTFFDHPVWAIAFTTLNALPIYLPVDDIGIQTDPLPRTLFHGLLAILLALLWKWRDKPERWWFLAAGLGGLVYIHAVSTPAWILAIFSSFLYLMPPKWNKVERIKWTGGLCLVTLITLVPFIQNYLQNTLQERQLPLDLDYRSYMQIFTGYYGSPDLHDVLRTTRVTLSMLTQSGLLPFGILGLLAVTIRRDVKQRPQTALVLIWFAAIIMISMIIPYIEKIVERRLEILPIQTELLRGVRFIRFLLSLSLFLGIKSVLQNRNKIYLSTLLGIGCALLTIGIYNNPKTLEMIKFPRTITCLKETKQLYCHRPSHFREAILFLREQTPIDAAIFFAPKPTDTSALAVRYMAHRSLVYSWKDRGLGFVRPDKLLDWYQIYSNLKENKNPSRWLSRQPHQFINFIQDIGANYYVTLGYCVPQNVDSSEAGIRLIFQNADYSICEIY